MFLDVNALAVNALDVKVIIIRLLDSVKVQDEGTHVFGCKCTSYIDHGLNEWLNNGFKSQVFLNVNALAVNALDVKVIIIRLLDSVKFQDEGTHV